MKSIKVKFNSTHTMLMHNNQGVNPTHPLTRQKKEYTGKRKKTDEDLEMIQNIDFELGLYHDEAIGPYVPAANVEACLREAAKKSRRGKSVISGVRVFPDYIPLEYDGPRDIEGLKKDMRFRDVKIGKIQKASVLITRPRFDHWSISFTLDYDESIFSDTEMEEIMITAGKYIGLNDYRPRYGTFEPVILKQ